MRENEFLKQRYRAILSYSGLILVLAGALMLFPLLALFIAPEEAKNAWAFTTPAFCLAGLGLICWRVFRPSSYIPITAPEGGVIVLISWTAVIVFSAWPFTAALHMQFSRAIFESMSGWTTTGLSVVDVSTAGQMILLWRSTMQLAGGAGLAIIMMSAVMGPTNAGISIAEGRSDQLVPHVQKSARLVLIIYAGYAAIGIIAYRWAGMSLFDAVNHAFAAISTGGFSTHAESIGYWNSVAVQAVTVPLMILGNLNFLTAWLMLKGRLGDVMRNGEVRLTAVLLPLSAGALFVFTSSKIYPQLEKSLCVAVFETASALTTTGFSSVGYGNWNAFGVYVLILLMLIGGGTCSTAGGIKQFRIYTLWKLMILELKRPFAPRTAVMEQSVWEGDRRVFIDDSKTRQISVFIFIYLLTYALGTLILCACGYSLGDSLFEFASALGTVGLSIGVTSAGMHDAALWAETIAMFLGRLEFFVLFVSILKLGKDAARILIPRLR